MIMTTQPTKPGVRCLCCFCQQDLPHSDPNGALVSHGCHAPPCPQTPPDWREAIEAVMRDKSVEVPDAA